MKKVMFIIAMMLSMTVMAQQPTVGFSTNEARYVGEDVIVPIYIANMPPVTAISLGFNFNPASIQYMSGGSSLSGFFTHVEPSFPDKVMIAWMSTIPIQIPDGVLGYIVFKYKKFESELRWITVGETCQFAVKSPTGGAPIKVAGITYTNGWMLPVVDIAGKTWMARNAVFGTKLSKTQQQTNNGIPEYHSRNDTLQGGYYKWDEAMQYTTTPGAQGICPSGWHVPTVDEWAELVRANLGDSIVDPRTGKKHKQSFTYYPLDTYNTAALKLKAANNMSYDKWSRAWTRNPGTGESGFNAIGAGYYYNGAFGGVMSTGYYFTSNLITFKEFDPVRYANKNGSDPVVIQFYEVDQTVRIVTLRRSTDHVSVRCIKN